jgi:hypothetical protein
MAIDLYMENAEGNLVDCKPFNIHGCGRVAAGAKIDAGMWVMDDGYGDLVPCTLGLYGLGVADMSLDNTLGSYPSKKPITFTIWGVVKLINSLTDAIDALDGIAPDGVVSNPIDPLDPIPGSTLSVGSYPTLARGIAYTPATDPGDMFVAFIWPQPDMTGQK